MPALPDRDGKPLAAAVYPAGNGEHRPGLMVLPSARGGKGIPLYAAPVISAVAPSDGAGDGLGKNDGARRSAYD